jgi:hypothetical protein
MQLSNEALAVLLCIRGDLTPHLQTMMYEYITEKPLPRFCTPTNIHPSLIHKLYPEIRSRMTAFSIYQVCVLLERFPYTLQEELYTWLTRD